MIEGKWFPQGAELTEPMMIRAAVFGRGRDALDDMAQQVVVYREGTPVGAARLWWEDGAFRLGDVGVLPDERGKGYGDLLVRLLLFKALSHNADTIALICGRDAKAFFARYGFTTESEGEPVCMRIRGAQVQLDHCKHCGNA